MKTKYFILAALAGLTFAGCSSDDLIAEAPPVNVNEGEAPIVFTSNQKAFTRADFQGADAAEKLGNKFVVFGYKGSETGDPGKATNSIAGSTVFDNYLVKYFENSANTTESNSNNWEYVGITDETTGKPIKHAVDHGITQQTIKYWDYSQSQYDFFAWSTGKKTAVYSSAPTADEEVLVTEMAATKATNPEKGLVAAYTFKGTAKALRECYISDLVTVYKAAKTGSDDTYNVVYAGYQKPVTLKFRQLGTKVRIGLYETVPGYSVKDVKFYTTGSKVSNPATQIVDKATIFSTAADIYTAGTYTVKFPTVDQPTSADNNQAHISFVGDGDQTTVVDWGDLKYTYRESGEKSKDAIYLGRTSNTASYAGNADDNYYVVYLPNETGANLNLRVNFTLESIDGSGEIIEVKNAKAQVPNIYTQWKPGFAYTYLFKISDNTNGRTGVYDPAQDDDATVNSDPAGLYPITFDAVVVNAEDNDGTQETITTIATPSITTYQQKSTVVNADEYTVNGKDIFVTVNTNWNVLQAGEDQGALVTMNTNAAAANGVALYTIPAGMTEAEVVDALTYQDEDDAASGTIMGRSGKVLTLATMVSSATDVDVANEWTLTNTVEFGADGNAITVGANQAMRFQPQAATYAFVYTKTAATGDADKNKDLYEPIKFSEVATFARKKYRYDYKATVSTKTVVDDKGTADTADDVTTDYYDAQKGHVYFTKTGSSEPYTYTKVANPFIGQGVSNLYLDAAGNTKASGYAVSGEKYYYTTNGQTYTEAHPVAYKADCSLTDLFKEGSTPGSYDPVDISTEKQPIDGVAYYYYDTVNSKYIYCVFLPQSVKDMFELDKDAAKVLTTEAPVDGQTYFDKYTVNDAVRYAKVIKVVN